MSVLCSMVGASFTVAAAAQVLRSKKGITAVGNAQVDTAQSKFGGASFQSDGAGDYLQIAPNSEFAFTGDFTVECFLRFSAHEQYGGIFSCANAGSTQSQGYQVIFNDTANTLNAYIESGVITGSTTLSTNTWHHIALVRSSGVFTLYINGTSNGTLSNSNTMDCSTHNFYWGTERTAGQEVTGHFDEMRVSSIARYTANFTPPTTAFVNDANTLLLIHADGTDGSTFFEDDNGVRAPKGIIAFGNAQVDTAQSKFGGSSAQFDGTGDYLTVQNIAGGITDAQTFEFWIRFADLPASGGFRMVAGDGSAARYLGVLNDGGTYRWEVSFSDGQYVERFTTSLSTGVWYHIALTKSGSTLKMYQAGTTLTSAVSFNTMSSEKTLFVAGTNYIGTWAPGSYFFNGHMDEIRVSNNVRYTANFTPSTTPFVNDANTLLLIHADGTDGSTVFRDDNGARAQQSIQAIGNAQIDTAQSKFGGSSALFDGTGDYLLVPYNLDVIKWNATSYSIEYWIRVGALNKTSYTDEGVEIPNAIGYGNATQTQTYWSFGPISNGSVRFMYYNGGFPTVTTTGVTLSINTWYHLAMVHSAGTIKIYVDGTERASASVSGTPNFTVIGATPLNIGHTGTNGFSGHIDEVRASSSVRYTAGFTPSTTPFQNDANTLLLMHMDGTDASTVFTDDNGIAPYTP
jgi:hypothetical protein